MIYPNATQVPTNKQGGKITPSLLVWHYTVCSAKGAIAAFSSGSKVKASAHFVIDREGNVTQMVPCDHKAWHAGVSSWGGRAGVNDFSIGVEMENVGPLRKSDDILRDWNGYPYHGESVEINGRLWAVYPEAQMQAAERLAEWIRSIYPSIESVGHSDISPGRKLDPGPAFQMEKLK